MRYHNDREQSESGSLYCGNEFSVTPFYVPNGNKKRSIISNRTPFRSYFQTLNIADHINHALSAPTIIGIAIGISSKVTRSRSYFQHRKQDRPWPTDQNKSDIHPCMSQSCGSCIISKEKSLNVKLSMRQAITTQFRKFKKPSSKSRSAR